jgi:hypothetical protein
MVSYLRKQTGLFIPDLTRDCQIIYSIPDSNVPVTITNPEELEHIDYVLWSINLDMKLFGHETDFSRTIPEIIKNK